MSKANFANRWELKKLIDAIAEEAGLLAGPAAYVVYLIYDPSRRDPHRQYRGLPLYVGETSELAKRFKSHMRRVLGLNGTNGSVHAEIYRMAQDGALPGVTVLGISNARAESLEVELRWAQKLLHHGYRLFNRMPGQAKAVNEHQYRRKQRDRLWRMTLAEAYAAKISMSLHCPSGCFSTNVDIRHYTGGDFPYRRLSVLKRKLKPCGACGKRLSASFEERPAA
ncbi:GIY-YIG nuclease family protein [Pacificimonas sp. WHA3]|uniref:GIY-YIG nuclease family protein n=1 Tax=Pacificimonas pallii TaxID=2827236 RepID=A0ABS6SCM2_9SPHN|nr:GIY-YIG nuclease family protein [Pacificimonas pallii]MBV7256129.1 GIY-YIG nuclease family protein [Pacificimonas pallii]